MMQTLLHLFTNQLQDAYSGETQLVKALPAMVAAANSADLKKLFQEHLEETKNQITRLEEVGRLINASVEGNTCEAMQGLIQESQEMIALEAEPHVKDAGLIAAAQKVEHYEMATYGCLCTWAEELDLADVQHLLHDILEEEKRADARLTQLAEARINALARR